MEEMIVGYVHSVIFENNQNGYRVINVEIDLDQTPNLLDTHIVCTGIFPSIENDILYEFFGRFKNHPKFGQQFEVNKYQQIMPTSETGIIEYLSSGRFTGIGKVTAKKIVNQLGPRTLDLIMNNDDLYTEIKGISKKVKNNLRIQLLKLQGTEKLFLQLNEWGISTKKADLIYRTLKDNAIEEIRANPYILVEKIEGMSFLEVDKIAVRINYPMTSQNRILAAVTSSILNQVRRTQHTYIPKDDAVELALQILNQQKESLISPEQVLEGLLVGIENKKVIEFDQKLMIPSLYFSELGIANFLYQHQEQMKVPNYEAAILDEAIAVISKELQITYDSVQIEALKKAIQSPLSIITGGPGTGKTTLIKGLIHLFCYLNQIDRDTDDLNEYITLTAPTGRAAKRLNEITGVSAKTIHRLIGFQRNDKIEAFEAREILDTKLLIVDEMSMVDTWVMYNLVQTMPFDLQLVFVGDHNQLPSVGPGKVFEDLIKSEVFTVIKLEKIFRQHEESSIIDLAHHVRLGRLPKDFFDKKNDRSFHPCTESQVSEMIKQIIHFAKKRNLNLHKIQVLSPMYEGSAGITKINQDLQQLINPPSLDKREITISEKLLYREGDRIIQMINNTELDIYNGDIGFIEKIYYADETESKEIEILLKFDEKIITYRLSDLSQILLAYCCSIHKSQGSEYDFVIMILVKSFYFMLKRNLLYTGITRAKDKLILIGDPSAYQQAIMSLESSRATMLPTFLSLKSHHLMKKKDVLDEANISQVVHQLTMDNYMVIDPMVGMGNISPYDSIQKGD